MRNPAPEWKQDSSALTEKLFQLYALSYALQELGANMREYLSSQNTEGMDAIEPLARLSLRLCREVEEHASVLEFHLSKASEDTTEREAANLTKK